MATRKAAAGDACSDCGKPHVTRHGLPACTGHRSGGYSRPEVRGTPCTQSPMHGQKVCGSHGGAAPQAKAAAKVKQQREQIERLALTFGEPIRDVDPGEIVAEQIAWRYGHVAWLRTRVQAIDPESLVWGLTKVKVGGDDGGNTSEAKPNAWLQLYLEAQRDLEKLCLEAIRAGLEERRVKLAEQQADVLVRVLDGVLAELGFDPNDQATAGVVERHLRLVAG